MKSKSSTPVFMCLFTILLFSGCNPIGDKTTNMSIIYLSTTILSLVMLLGYFLSIRKTEPWFVVLFVAVFVVNAGYFLLSISDTLNKALWANRISYLGSAFLPLSMIMIIMKVSRLRYKKFLPVILLVISTAVFLLAASPGYLNIYYKSVSLEHINGVSVLIKEYGSWHCVYLFYLLGYFGIMVATTLHAIVKKKIDSTAHAIILVISVFVNILVWFLEQLVEIDFEFLSVSYIITELFLISVYLMIDHQESLVSSLREKITTARVSADKSPRNESPEFLEHLKFFSEQISALTASEKSIYDCYVAGMSTKEVLAERSITENTLKYHNRNIYGKLGVSSRKELLEYAKALDLPPEENNQ